MTETIRHFPETPLWTALVTPMLPDGSIDYASLDTLVAQQNEAGNGILLLGSTGEALAIPLKQRKALINHVLANRPDVPIMSGIGGFQLQEELAWLDFCQQAGVNAFLLGSPIYAKPGPEGQYQWFKAMLDRSTKPCLIYNIPGRSALSLSLDSLKRLADHPHFWGIKEASGDLDRVRETRSALPHINLYSGDDALMPAMSKEGAVGLVSVASNVWPKATHAFVLKAKEDPNAPDLADMEGPMNTLFMVSNPIPAKCLLAERGDIAHNTLLAPLTADEIKDISPLLKADQEAKQWFQNQS